MSPGKICSNAEAKKRLWRQLVRCAQALKVGNQWIISTTGEVRCQQSADRSLGYSNSILADGTVDIVCNFPKPMALVLGDAYESRPGVFHRDLRQHWKTCVEAVLVDHTKTFPVGIAATTARTVLDFLTNQKTMILGVA